MKIATVIAAALAAGAAGAAELSAYLPFEDGEVDGIRGKAAKWSALAAESPEQTLCERVDPAQGTLSVWMLRPRGALAAPVADEWENRTVVWHGADVRVFRNGMETPAPADGAAEAIAAHTPFRLSGGRLVSGGLGCDAVDELRLYSAPLADSQILELWRREQVVEISVAGSFGIADCAGEVSVRAESPAGCAMEGLKYCICDASNRVIVAYAQSPRSAFQKLVYNLPEGQYYLRATDGTWFYGLAPLSILPPGERRAPATSGEGKLWANSEPGRLWSDLFAGRRSAGAAATAAARRGFALLKNAQARDCRLRVRRADGTFAADAGNIARARRILAAAADAGADALLISSENFDAAALDDWPGAWVALAEEAGLELALAPSGAGSADAALSLAARYYGAKGFGGVAVMRGAAEPKAISALAKKLRERCSAAKLYILAGEDAPPAPRCLEPNAIDAGVAESANAARLLGECDYPFLVRRFEGAAAASFPASFRMLPRDEFAELARIRGGVVLRGLDWNGRKWAYAVNAGAAAAEFALEMPGGARNLADGAKYGGFFGGDETARFRLAPGEMAVFVSAARFPKPADAEKTISQQENQRGQTPQKRR